MPAITEPSFDPTGTGTLRVIADAHQFNRWMYDTIRPWLKGEILEIGSGIANISSFAIADGLSITLSDINPEYREHLQQHFPSTRTLEIDLQHADFNSTYASLASTFDSIFLLNVIEHLADDRAAMRHCDFMLKPGGNVVLLAPSFRALYSRMDKELGHYRRYTKKTLSAIPDPARFDLIKKTYFNFAGLPGWLIFGKVLGHKQLGGEMRAFAKMVPLFKWLDKLTFHQAGLSTIIVAKKKAL